MIKIISKAYSVGDKTYSSLVEAQKQEIVNLLQSTGPAQWIAKDNVALSFTMQNIADFIVDNSASVLDILTTTPNSRPKRRKIHKEAISVAPLSA